MSGQSAPMAQGVALTKVTTAIGEPLPMLSGIVAPDRWARIFESCTSPVSAKAKACRCFLRTSHHLPSLGVDTSGAITTQQLLDGAIFPTAGAPKRKCEIREGLVSLALGIVWPIGCPALWAKPPLLVRKFYSCSRMTSGVSRQSWLQRADFWPIVKP